MVCGGIFAHVLKINIIINKTKKHIVIFTEIFNKRKNYIHLDDGNNYINDSCCKIKSFSGDMMLSSSPSASASAASVFAAAGNSSSSSEGGGVIVSGGGGGGGGGGSFWASPVNMIDYSNAILTANNVSASSYYSALDYPIYAPTLQLVIKIIPMET